MKLPIVLTTTALLFAAGCQAAPVPSAPTGKVSPDQYLKSIPHPVFKSGHTLPRLTRFAYYLPFDTKVALTEDWGYALEFGSYAEDGWNTADSILNNPKSDEARTLALTKSDPQKYPLSVLLNHSVPKEIPREAWIQDAEGHFLDGTAQWSVDTATAKQGTFWSPEAPDSIFQQMAELRLAPIRKILERAPIDMVLNGGEYGLSVGGAIGRALHKDPRSEKRRVDRSWFEYISQAKARQEMNITKAVRETIPGRSLYIWYANGANPHANRYGTWDDWAWDFKDMQSVADLPSNSLYYKEYNSGWTGDADILTQALNSRGIEISYGWPLGYQWVSAGWKRGEEGDKGFGDIARYTGFLKCLYTAGTVGANAGYYGDPHKEGLNGPDASGNPFAAPFAGKFDPNDPPHWIRQMTALGQVHALYSYLEPFLREGYLLPGPNRHKWTKDDPAYEFPTGDATARVLARRMKNEPEFIITAWAADGTDRDVKVSIPELGEVTVKARACGSTYHAVIKDGQPVLTLLDEDGLAPTVSAQAQSTLDALFSVAQPTAMVKTTQAAKRVKSSRKEQPKP
jgi:hypothetical protein